MDESDFIGHCPTNVQRPIREMLPPSRFYPKIGVKMLH